MDIALLGSIVYALLNNPPAHSENYIGPEEKHKAHDLSQVPCSFTPVSGSENQIFKAGVFAVIAMLIMLSAQSEFRAQGCSHTPSPLPGGIAKPAISRGSGA